MTIYSDLQAAGLPVISASENGEISMGAMTEAQQQQFFDVVLNHFKPSDYVALQTFRSDRQTLVNVYANMITRLEQIQAAANPTNAQVIAAVQDLSLYIERILKVIKRIV